MVWLQREEMRSQSAFTLVELVVTVAILGIMIMFALPSFQNLTSGNRMLEARESMLAAIRYAKGEAVGLNRTISVCPSADGTGCGQADDWAEGWLVVLDRSDSGAVAVAGTLRVFQGPQVSEVTMTHGGIDYIRFLPNGLAESLAGTYFGFCDPDKNVAAYSLIVSPTTGQARTGTEAEAQCP